jgi:hypothetical protein
MRSTVPQSSWPDSWVRGHGWDLAAAAESAEDFRAIPEGYADAKRGYANAYRNRLRVTLDAIRRVAPPGSSILDVAAGQGNFSLASAELGYEVTWNDRLAGWPVMCSSSTSAARFDTRRVICSISRANTDSTWC